MDLSILKKNDLEIFTAIQKELVRQETGLELIASENYVSRAVMQALGTVLTNKYAEGYPGKRYYGGCEFVDIAENIAIDRVKKLFKADFANVQPHSGAQANAAVFMAELNPGDTILGMNLSHGGHLTHGSPVNMSGKWFKVVPYGVSKETGKIDYAELEAIAKKEKPKMIIAGASAYPRAIEFDKFRKIADEVGALLMVDMAHIAGLVAADLHQSPIPYADYTTSTTHKTLRGPRGGLVLAKEANGKKLNSAVFPGLQGGPLMHVIAAKAVAFGEALSPDFKKYQTQVLANAQALAKALMAEGISLASGGTDNHLMLVDLTKQDITGKEAEAALDKAGITVNKNTIPFETRSPFITSGFRIGTPAVTTRGMKENEMKLIASLIVKALNNKGDDEKLKAIHKEVNEICKAFPLYKDLIEA